MPQRTSRRVWVDALAEAQSEQSRDDDPINRYWTELAGVYEHAGRWDDLDRLCANRMAAERARGDTDGLEATRRALADAYRRAGHAADVDRVWADALGEAGRVVGGGA